MPPENQSRMMPNAVEKISHQDATHALRLKGLLFGAAREAAGCDEFELTIKPPATAADVREQILRRFPELRRFGRSLLMAVNEEYAPPDLPIKDGDEIALFPPVSGGAESAQLEEQTANTPHDFFELTTNAIDVGAIARRFVSPRCGATVTLDGYARAFTKNRPPTLYLIYEAYAPMALREMRRLGAEAHRLFDIEHIGIVHRTGRTEIGETSVVVTVSAPHRRAAFEACEWAIRELKRTVPIWKKEFYADGSVWVEGEQSALTGDSKS
jgi:molybdopterin converting factor subunit 1